MAKYTINGKTYNSAAPLSDDDLEELAAEAGVKPSAPIATPAATDSNAEPNPDRSAWDVAKGAIHAIRTGGEEGTTDQDRKDFDTARSLPKRGLKGAAVAVERGLHGDNLAQALHRGSEATKEGYEPKPGEKLADFAGEMADPQMMPINAVGGEAIGLAGKLVKPLAKGAGKLAAEGIETFTGVHPHNTAKLFEKPLEIAKKTLLDPFKKYAKKFQMEKIKAGVTPEEERLIAQVDLGGYKKVADNMAKKVAAGEELTVGETLAGKKAAGKVSTKGEGSAKAIYGKDQAKMSEILKEKAPDVTKAQADVADVKTGKAFLSPFARKGGSAKGHFVRNVMGAGLLASGNPAGLVFSPMTAGLATVLASAGTKAATKTASSPISRAALIAAFNKAKQGGK